MRSVSKKQFEALLIEIRNAASASLGKITGGKDDAVVIEDLRTVRFAAEAALAVLNVSVYYPKREAVADMRYILDWLDSKG